jgi:hypothetical protein
VPGSGSIHGLRQDQNQQHPGVTSEFESCRWLAAETSSRRDFPCWLPVVDKPRTLINLAPEIYVISPT